MPETQPTSVAEYIPHCGKLIRVARADLVAFKSGTESEGKRNAMKIRNRNIPKGRAGHLAAKAICFLKRIHPRRRLDEQKELREFGRGRSLRASICGRQVDRRLAPAASALGVAGRSRAEGLLEDLPQASGVEDVRVLN